MPDNRDEFNEKFSESAKNAINFTTQLSISKSNLLHPKKVAPLIKVAIKLKPKQSRGIDKWECTVKGASIQVSRQDVEFYCEDMPHVLSSYDPDEISKVTITAEYDDD